MSERCHCIDSERHGHLDDCPFAEFESLRSRLAEAESRQTCEGTQPYICHALATARSRLAEAEQECQDARVARKQLEARLENEAGLIACLRLQVDDVTARLAEVETDRDNWIATAELHYKEEQALEKRVASALRDYEDLRREIDGGSESMTHVDAIDAIRTYRERIAALELYAKSWRREAEMNADAGEMLSVAIAVLKEHDIHVAEKWCWCNPTINDYRHMREQS